MLPDGGSWHLQPLPSCPSLPPCSHPTCAGCPGYPVWGPAPAQPLPPSSLHRHEGEGASRSPRPFHPPGVSAPNSWLFEGSRGFGAPHTRRPDWQPQPVPASCVLVTAKHTAHQLPEPCSPGESSGIRRCQTAGCLSLSLAVGSARCCPWPECEGHPPGWDLGVGKRKRRTLGHS